jgi:hypothetical protein
MFLYSNHVKQFTGYLYTHQFDFGLTYKFRHIFILSGLREWQKKLQHELTTWKTTQNTEFISYTIWSDGNTTGTCKLHFHKGILKHPKNCIKYEIFNYICITGNLLEPCYIFTALTAVKQHFYHTKNYTCTYSTVTVESL